MNPCTYCGDEHCPGCAQCDECGVEYHEDDLVDGLCDVCDNEESGWDDEEDYYA